MTCLTTLHIATQHRRDVLAISNPPQPPAGEDPKRHLIVLPESRLVARKKLQEFGEALFKRVFAGPVAEALRTNAKEAKDAKLGLRVRLHLDNLPEFQDVPWEYLYDTESPGEFMLHSTEWSLVRNLPLPNPPLLLPPEHTFKVLVLIASPNGLPELDVQKEWENLNEAIQANAAGQVRLEPLRNASLKALLNILLQQDFHAIHFIGHGGFEGDEGVLMFEDDDTPGKARPVRADQLGAIVRNFNTLRLVVLNACEGARTSSRDPFAGVAQRLIGLDLPVVVAMQYVISDRAAILFSSMFYTALAKGHSVDAAMTQARVAIYTNADAEFEFGIPVLHMRLEDGRLFSHNPSSEPRPVLILSRWLMRALIVLVAGSLAYGLLIFTPLKYAALLQVPPTWYISGWTFRTLKVSKAGRLMRGDDVWQAQQRLLALGYAEVEEADAKYGTKTALAVKGFQSTNKLRIDGEVGPQTWPALFSPSAVPASAPVSK